MSVNESFQKLVASAAKIRASDIYIMPVSDGFSVYCYTAAGVKRLTNYDNDVGASVVRHIKYGAQMDLGDTRRPQLGRWAYVLAGERINLRVSSVGDFLNRESVVIRILYEQNNQQLHWADYAPYQALCDTIKTQSGLVLLAGRMGSGKTTTLYSAVSKAAAGAMVLTIEDPVEIVAPEFLQLQVNDRAGMAYPDLLKLALRHHPDIMIVGEIRDAKTAHLVVEAALSGHLIVSTVHARSAVGVWYRLLDFGVDPVVLRQVLTGVGYQQMGMLQNRPTAKLTYLTGEQLGQVVGREADG
jgi:competence protein ComGA